MPRISSLITRGLRAFRVTPGYWRIPQGVIIMYSAAADPGLSGWTRYSAADGKFIKGTATQSEIGTITANNNSTWQNNGYSASTGTAGLHSGPSSNYQGYAPGSTFPQTSVDTYPYSAGEHSHIVTFFPGAGSDLNPASTDYILLQSTAENKTLPAGAILGRSTQPTNSTQEVSSTTYRYIRGGSSYTNTAATSRTCNGSTDSGGGHSHGPSYYTGIIYGGSTNTALSQTPNNVSPGVHNHVSSGTITGSQLTGKLFKLWKLASEMTDINDNIILMYTGTISSLPSYWHVCDGTNGTPNMVNYFLGYSTAATAHDTTTTYNSLVSTGGLASDPYPHAHIGGSITSRIGYPNTNYHTSTTVSHSHTTGSLSGGAVFQPDEIKLCFIQLTKTIY